MEVNPIFTSSSPMNRTKELIITDIPIYHHSSSRSTPIQINSEKLKLSYEKSYLENQVTSLKNRINKLLTEEKAAVKAMNQVKSTAEEIQKKKERNQQRLKEKLIIQQKKYEDTLKLKEKVQYERIIRARNIKKLEENIIKERRNFAVKLKETQKEWDVIIEKDKKCQIEVKHKQKLKVKSEMTKKKQERSISQMSQRRQIRLQYEQRVDSLREQKEIVRKSVALLQEKQDEVNQHVTDVLKTRDKCFEQFLVK